MDHLSIAERAHVQLTGCHAPDRPMRSSVDIETAGSAYPLPAVMVKSDRISSFGDKLLIEHIKHFKKRDLSRDAAYLVRNHLPTRFGVLLPPDFKRIIHNSIAYLYERCEGLTTSKLRSSRCSSAAQLFPLYSHAPTKVKSSSLRRASPSGV